MLTFSISPWILKQLRLIFKLAYCFHTLLWTLLCLDVHMRYSLFERSLFWVTWLSNLYKYICSFRRFLRRWYFSWLYQSSWHIERRLMSYIINFVIILFRIIFYDKSYFFIRNIKCRSRSCRQLLTVNIIDRLRSPECYFLQLLNICLSYFYLWHFRLERKFEII